MSIDNDEINNATEEKTFFLIPENAPDAMSDTVDMAVLKGFEDAQIEGEPDLIVELIDLYLADASEKLTAMRQAVTKADEQPLKRAAHSLMGSSANLGARRMASLCEEIERIDGDHWFQEAEALVARLEPEFEFVRQVFSAERRRRS